MPNIQFNYLYRDSANYKKFSSIIFANPNNIELEEIEILIRSKLISGEWFYAKEWGLPELFTGSFDYNIDPNWHEFECVEYSENVTDEIQPIEVFIKTLNSIKTDTLWK